MREKGGIMGKIRALICILICFTAFSTTGVYAAWTYAGSPNPEKEQVSIAMGEWEPHVLLPDNENGLAGTDHSVMMQEILDNSKAGLNPKPQVLLGAITNSNKNPYAKDGLFYSKLEKVSGGNLKFLFESNIVNIEFTMETIEPEQAYYFYTYHAALSSDLGKTIKTYRTKVEYINREWQATTTAEGIATVISRYGNGQTFYAIDHTSWKNT